MTATSGNSSRSTCEILSPEPCSGLVFRRKLRRYATHMNQAMLIEVLRRYDAALRENGATGLFIFGTRAVGAQRPDSDLDLFIDYDPDTKIPNMFRLMQIEAHALKTVMEAMLARHAGESRD